MAKKKKDIVNQVENRYGLFVNHQSNNLDILYGQQFIKNDNVHEVFLFKINIVESKSHGLYGQAKSKDKVYSKPIRLHVMPTMDENKQEQYGGSGLIREDTGDLEFGVYMKELQELNVDIDRGDIIRYNLSGQKNRFYEVTNARNVNDTPEFSFGGFYTYWKKITATPVKDDVLPIEDEAYDFNQYSSGSGVESYDKSNLDWLEPITRIPEAPDDGNQYVRKNEDWHVLEEEQADWGELNPQAFSFIKNKPFIIPEAPQDNKQYVRKNGDWISIVVPEQIQADWNELDDTAFSYIRNKPFIMPEAPQDGFDYVRNNGVWTIHKQSDWNETNILSGGFIRNKPSLYKRFLELDDVIPESFLGWKDSVPIVTEDETALDLIQTQELETVLAQFIHLSDVPNNYNGQGDNFLRINGTEDGISFYKLQPSDWNEINQTSLRYIANKPIILNEIQYQFNVNPENSETFVLNMYVTTEFSIKRILIESDDILSGVTLNINNNPDLELGNMEITPTMFDYTFNTPIQLSIGDRITLNTSGVYTGVPTIILCKILY